MSDVSSGRIGLVPPHLRDGHYSGAEAMGSGVGYKYAHDYPGGVVAQQYPPDPLVGRDYYAPTEHGFERELGPRVGRLRAIVRGLTGRR